MRFKGTRGQLKALSFTEVVLSGMADNGGLWVPESFPEIDFETQKKWKSLCYNDLCFEIMKLFIGPEEISHEDLYQIINNSYKNFEFEEIVEIVNYEPGNYLLNLFHGPTFAFKDIALQFLGAIFEYFIQKGIAQKINLIGSTSGDTGSAAICGIKGKSGISCTILFPKGRTSIIQELQMITNSEDNIHCISIEGTYDDCQRIVKSILNSSLKETLNLAAVNSINFARILSQMIYFWFSSLQLSDTLSTEMEKIDFTVPTGNFGNILSAYYAKKMNAPIRNLVIASNSNDILTRFHKSGHYKSTEVIPTISPAMDIQISSNFERMLFESFSYSTLDTMKKFNSLHHSGEFSVAQASLQKVQEEFFAYSASEQETETAIKEFYELHNIIIDPHTAVGYVCANKYKSQSVFTSSQKHVIVSTAHYGKFIDSVQAILPHTHCKPSIPCQLIKENLSSLPQKVTVLKPDVDAVINHLNAVL